MHILIATDGALPIERTVSHLQRVHRPEDEVTVMTAINLPRRLLKALEAMTSDASSVADIVEAAGPGQGGFGGGDRIAERLKRDHGSQDLPMDEFLRRYFEKVAEESIQPLVGALSEAGIKASTLVREANERTAATVIDVCRELKTELLVIGDTGRGRFEGLMGSTGTKLVRHAPCDVLLIRVPT